MNTNQQSEQQEQPKPEVADLTARPSADLQAAQPEDTLAPKEQRLYRTDTEALDECLRLMFTELRPDDFRTDGGNINMPKVRSQWRARPDRVLMSQLSARFGVCVGKNVYGVAYVGYPGKQDVILAYDEGPNPAEAELLAVIRAVAKIGSRDERVGPVEGSSTPVRPTDKPDVPSSSSESSEAA